MSNIDEIYFPKDDINQNNLDEILTLSPTALFENINENQTEGFTFNGENELFQENNENSLPFSNLQFSPDYCYDDGPKDASNPYNEDQLTGENEETNFRRKSSRIEDQVRSRLAEKIRLENDRMEREAMQLEKGDNDDSKMFRPKICDEEEENGSVDLDESEDDAASVVLSSAVKITLKPATQESTYEEYANVENDSVKSNESAKTQICDQLEANPLSEKLQADKSIRLMPKKVESSSNNSKGIKYQSCQEIKCFGLTCRKNVNIWKSLYCSPQCLKSYVNSMLESNRRCLKDKYGEKKAIILAKNQRLVLLDRKTGDIFSGRQAPRARTDDVSKFLKLHPTCQIIRDKFSNSINAKRPSEEQAVKEASKCDDVKKEIFTKSERMNNFFQSILSKQIRESKSLLIINKKRLEEICSRLVEELKSLYIYETSVEAFDRHIENLHKFFDSRKQDCSSYLGVLEFLLRGEISTAKFISHTTTPAQLSLLMKQFKIPSHQNQTISNSTLSSQKDDPVQDTTSQHGKQHFFDKNCSICQKKSSKSQNVKAEPENVTLSTLRQVRESLNKNITTQEISPSTIPKTITETQNEKEAKSENKRAPAETSCCMVNLNAENPCQIDLNDYALSCTDPGHELNMILASFMKCTLYPLGNVQPPKLDLDQEQDSPEPQLPILPTFLRIVGGCNQNQVGGFIQKHLSHENREVITYLILPGTMSYIDEKSLVLYHRFMQHLVHKSSTGILANAEINSLADKFKQVLIYVGKELPFFLNVEQHDGTDEELRRRGLYRYFPPSYENHVKNTGPSEAKMYLILVRKKCDGPRKLVIPEPLPEVEMSLASPSEDRSAEETKAPETTNHDNPPAVVEMTEKPKAFNETLNKIDVKRMLSTLSQVFSSKSVSEDKTYNRDFDSSNEGNKFYKMEPESSNEKLVYSSTEDHHGVEKKPDLNDSLVGNYHIHNSSTDLPLPSKDLDLRVNYERHPSPTSISASPQRREFYDYPASSSERMSHGYYESHDAPNCGNYPYDRYPYPGQAPFRSRPPSRVAPYDSYPPRHRLPPRGGGYRPLPPPPPPHYRFPAMQNNSRKSQPFENYPNNKPNRPHRSHGRSDYHDQYDKSRPGRPRDRSHF